MKKNISDIIKFNLINEGLNVSCAYNGLDGLTMFQNSSFDLVLLDIMMPKMDGIEVCTEIRKFSDVPIIMLTAKAEELDKVLGLEVGADDYVTKPFSNKELVARIKANLRRSSSYDTKNIAPKDTLVFGELTLDTNKFEVLKNNITLNLTKREYELVHFLATQKDQVFTREELLEKVWGYEYYGDLRTVDVTIRRLRAKLEDNSEKPRYILTKRGIGYSFGG